jgi:hypothetical protein
MIPLKIVIGFILLVAGSQIPWLFAGGIVFLVGDYAASHLYHFHSDLQLILYSLSAGVLGVLLALNLKRIILGVAGFFAGGFLVLSLPGILSWQFDLPLWQFSVGAGLVCMLLTLFSPVFTLILLSSLLGSSLIIQSVQFGSLSSQMMFFVLLILGILFQIVLYQYASPAVEN